MENKIAQSPVIEYSMKERIQFLNSTNKKETMSTNKVSSQSPACQKQVEPMKIGTNYEDTDRLRMPNLNIQRQVSRDGKKAPAVQVYDIDLESVARSHISASEKSTK